VDDLSVVIFFTNLDALSDSVFYWNRELFGHESDKSPTVYKTQPRSAKPEVTVNRVWSIIKTFFAVLQCV